MFDKTRDNVNIHYIILERCDVRMVSVMLYFLSQKRFTKLELFGSLKNSPTIRIYVLNNKNA